MSDIKPIEIFTAFDLELNQPSRSIIQIGAVIGNITNGQILERISIFINPEERVSSDIVNLTKITQADVDGGLSLSEGYEKVKKKHEQYYSFMNCLTWGGDDTLLLLNQLKDENLTTENWCFGRRCIDVKTLFVSWRIANGQPIQGGLARSMTKIGLKFKGQKHNAVDDAENTFKMYCGMLCLLKKDTK